MTYTRLTITVLSLLTIAYSQAPQGVLLIPQERVLAFDMKGVPIGPYVLHSGAQSAGFVWEQQIIHPSATKSVRVQIKIKDLTQAPGWSIELSDLLRRPVGQDSMMQSLQSLGEWWSDPIVGRGAIIRVRAQEATTIPTIIINRYAYATQPSIPKSLYANKLQTIASAPAFVQSLGPPIAKLRFMLNGDEALCSGFLLTTELLLTNNHCIGSKKELSSAIVEFGYDNPASKTDRYRAVALEATSISLDYSIVRLAGEPGKKYGNLTLLAATPSNYSPQPESGNTPRPLAIIQHPGGEPKQVSIVMCQARGNKLVGVTDPTDFGHTCDTNGGSSGSPVIELLSSNVIGLHHFGFKDHDEDPVNQAVYIGLILQDLVEVQHQAKLLVGMTIKSAN